MEEIQILVLCHLRLLSRTGTSPAPHAPCSHKATLSLGGATEGSGERTKVGHPEQASVGLSACRSLRGQHIETAGQ